MEVPDKLLKKLLKENEEWTELFQGIRLQRERHNTHQKKEKQKVLKESQHYRYPGDTVIYKLDLREIEAAEKRKSRWKFYWRSREYLYTSGKPYDLVDLFKIGEV